VLILVSYVCMARSRALWVHNRSIV